MKLLELDYLNSEGVIAINLIEALKEQMDICKNTDKYICYVFVNSKKHMDIVKNVLSNIIEIPNRVIHLQAGNMPEARWNNDSVMRITIPNDNVRGMRFSGLIIDNDIDNNIVRTCILPRLISNDVPKISYVGISMDDLDKSKQYRQVYISTGWRSNNLFIDELSFMNEKLFEKEYKCMFYENDYDRPVVEKEVNNDKVLLYEAWGIPKDMITYETEFINKTKQTYLNIKGEFKNEIIGFENDINVHLRIDTYIYDGYEVHIEDGLVTVILHEIKNEAPVLKDYGVV